jgi:hypothetical protein
MSPKWSEIDRLNLFALKLALSVKIANHRIAQTQNLYGAEILKESVPGLTLGSS